MLNEAVVNKGLELLDTAVKVATTEGPVLLSQYLNLMIFNALLEVFRNSLFMLGAYLVVRIVNALIKNADADRVDLEAEYTSAKGKLVPDDDCSVLQVDRARNNLAMKRETLTYLRAVRTLAIIIPAILLTVKSLPAIAKVGKIVVAPQVYLIEEGVKVLSKKSSLDSKPTP